MVKIGLIGCGRIARFFHLKVLSHLQGAKFVALAESHLQRRAEAVAIAPGVAAFADYNRLLERGDVDVVVICLPTNLHAQAAIAALKAGKHVYLEKPLATNSTEAQAVLQVWQESDKIGMIGFNNRFHPLFKLAKQELRKGRIGKIVGCRSVLCSARRRLPQWKEQRESGGGALLDLAIHHTDIVSFLFEESITEVSATTWSVQSEDDNAFLEMNLQNGLVIQGYYSMTAVQDNRFEVFGDGGSITVNRYGNQLDYNPPERSYNRLDRLALGMKMLFDFPGHLWNALMPPAEPSYQIALQAFVDAVNNNAKIEPDFAAAFRSLQVIFAAEESARVKHPVPIAK